MHLVLANNNNSNSRTLDDAPHYDTNTEINTSRYSIINVPIKVS